LRGTERNRCILAARRAPRARFSAHPRPAVGSLGLALLASLGVVLELLVVKKQLLACGENKFFAAINTLQDSIGKFHRRLPRTQVNALNRPSNPILLFPFPVSFVFPNTGPGR
jgi:hypothetical protein